MRRSQIIDHLSEKGELPASVVKNYANAIVFYANLLHDEDSNIPVKEYAKDLTSSYHAPERGHNYGGTNLSLIDRETKEYVSNVADALIDGKSLHIVRENAIGDPGMYTKYGISYKHIVGNPGGISGYLYSLGLLDELDVFHFEKPLGRKGRFLACKNAKVSFCYFLNNFADGDFLPRIISEQDLLQCTLSHLGYTAYYGIFTLFRAKKGDVDLKSRPKNGINGTKVYRSDMTNVLNNYKIEHILEFAQNVDAALYGTHYKKKVQTKSGEAYKNRFCNILKRLINVRDFKA